MGAVTLHQQQQRREGGRRRGHEQEEAQAAEEANEQQQQQRGRRQRATSKLALATACCFLAATLVVCLASRLVDLDHSAIDPSPRPPSPPPSLTQRGLKVVALDDEEQPMASSWHSFQQGFLAFEQSFVGASIEVLLVIYLFLGIAYAADDYFVESLNIIASKVGMSDDVAGATLMALGCSAPEFFTNVGSVIFSSDTTPNDVGMGTIVGAALFNLFLVIGLCAVLSPNGLELTKGPIIRDFIFYAGAVALLIAFTEHLHVKWWEGLILVLWYLVYGIFLTFNRQILAWCARRYNHFRNIDDMELETLLVDGDGKGSEIDDDEEEDTPFWRVYKYIIMPYILLFRFTLPDVSEKSPMRNWYVVTFLGSLLYLAGLTVAMVYLVTRAAHSFGVSTAITGVIFVSWGTSAPDCLSSLIVARRGMADMAVSNALGSNIFNISLALGFPWLIGTLASQTDIRIESTALVWTTVILVAALLLYGLLLLIGKFHLQKTSGFLLVFCYLLYTAFQVWAEYQGLNTGATPMTPTPAPMYYGGGA